MSKRPSRLMILALLMLCLTLPAYATDVNQSSPQPYDDAKDRASRSMNAMLYGPAEMSRAPAAIATDMCGHRNRTDVEKGIAGIITGVWQLATFWYPDTNRENYPSGSVRSPDGKKAD